MLTMDDGDAQCKSQLGMEVNMTRACEQMPRVRMPLPLLLTVMLGKNKPVSMGGPVAVTTDDRVM